MSSSSITRSSASPTAIGQILMTGARELLELALYFLVDVERLLALPLAALVARDDVLADLVTERGISRQLVVVGEQLLDLGVDVQRLFPLELAAIGLGLDHLPDLLLPHGRRLGFVGVAVG